MTTMLCIEIAEDTSTTETMEMISDIKEKYHHLIVDMELDIFTIEKRKDLNNRTDYLM